MPAFIGASNPLVTTTSGALDTRAHSPSCGEQPVYKTRSRPRGANGRKGQDGSSPSTTLFSGNAGQDGTASFVVINADGTQSHYRGAFDCLLVGFEVIDENEDGIFEPGECAIIQNIRITNIGKPKRHSQITCTNRCSPRLGEMPTPGRTDIPITLFEPRILAPVRNCNPVLIPHSIPRGHSETARRRIWAQIPTPAQPSNIGTEFRLDERLQLQAVIPHIQRAVRNFDVSQSLAVQYPLGMDRNGFMWLESMPVGSQGSFRWTVSGEPAT